MSTMLKFLSGLLDFNQATLSGCIDTIVIEHEDGTLVGSPFHVRFGKLKLLKSAEKEVNISVNGQDTGLKMKLGKSGEAYFLQPIDDAKSTEEKLDDLDEKEEEVKENLGVDVDDLYKGVEFFEEASLKKMDQIYSDHKEEEKQEENEDDEGDVEGEDQYEDAIGSDTDSIEKMKSEDKYNEIINELESQSEKEKQAKNTPTRTTRFGWVWGETPIQENEENKLELSVRERSKSESGAENLRYSALSTSKSEKGEELPKLDSGDNQNRKVNGEPTPPRKGIIGRFMGLFRGNPEEGNEDETTPHFKLQKVTPKKGDFGAITPREDKDFSRVVGMSLCKHLLYT